MPYAPARPCTTCGTVGCQAHTRPPWGHAQPVARIRGSALQGLRKRLFASQPLCVTCLEDGRTALATIRDHVIPLAEGGHDDETNTQPLCQACSDAKTHEEAQRGRIRGN